MSKGCAWLVAIVFVLFQPLAAQAQETQVSLAGVAYSGDAATIAQRFPYTTKYEQALKAAGGSPLKHILAALAQASAQHLKLSVQPLDELKGRDQALVVSLVLNSETVSVEHFADVRKLFVLVRGTAMFFDFKTMTVVRAYPLSFAFIDNLRRDPTEAEVLESVRKVYEGAGGKPGMYGRFASALATAKVPAQAPRFLQVTQVKLPPAMVETLPAYLKSQPSVYETWAADIVSEAISTRLDVPVVPYAKGHAVGNVMSMKVSDGDVYSLTLPKPDYAISVDFQGLRKVKYSESGAGASFVYGSFATVRIEEPFSQTVYMNTALKNAEVKVVPATQTWVDDFPAYYDSVNGMFHKLADAVAGKDTKWVKAAAAAPDIDAQLTKTRELMNLCK